MIEQILWQAGQAALVCLVVMLFLTVMYGSETVPDPAPSQEPEPKQEPAIETDTIVLEETSYIPITIEVEETT